MSTVEDTNKETTEATQEEPQVDFVVDGASAKRKRDEESAEENSTETTADEDQQKKAKVEDSPKKSEDQPTVSTTEPTTETKAATPTATSPVVAPVAAPVATETLPATTTTANGQELLILEIAPDKVGQVIGSKGLVIQEIQTRTGARAFVNQDFPPGVNRQANITGTAAQVKAAAELINMIISQGPTSIHVNSMGGGPTITQVIECSQPQVGKIIGSNGGTIKELQSKSGARIQIDQDFPPEVPRKINLTGTAAAVNLGIQLIQSIMAGNSPFPSAGGMGMGVYGPGAGGMGVPAVGQMQMNGSQASQIMDVPKSVVGKIIGRGGENINIIQRKSGARTQIDQSVPEGTPCKVHMTGSPQSIQMCMQMIQQIMMGVPMEQVGANMAPGGGMPMQTPYGGGMGAYGGMGGMGMGGMGGMGMGGMGGMPQQMGMQQPQYGGYGMPQQQMGQMGGMPGMGNMGMSNPSAGGYQAYGAAAGAGGMYPGMQQQQHQGYGVQQGMGGMQAAPAVAKPAASAWSEHKTDEGVTYWYNASTGVSQVSTLYYSS